VQFLQGGVSILQVALEVQKKKKEKDSKQWILTTNHPL